MRSSKLIQIVTCHAEGEVGDVIIGGVAPPPGDTIYDQSRWIAQDDTLRQFVLNEPRGGVFRHVNLLVPAKDPRAQMGFIIMEPADTPLMSGSNSICVATVLLDAGIVPMVEPETALVLEAPGGLIHVRAACRDGKAQSITVQNVPSYADQLDATVDVPGIGQLTVDTAWGGDSFVVVSADQLGLKIRPENARALAEVGMAITRAADEQLGFRHPENGWSHISFCQITEPVTRGPDGVLTGRSAVAIRPGKIDRSPTGTGCSARMALMAARGEMAVGDRYVGRSIIDTAFDCRIADVASVGPFAGIVPEITGRAWVAGTQQLMLDPDDPFPQGYRLSDTWSGA
ncbi:MAG: hypothetical protein DI498_03140 [Paracoccus denitrificans]|nr:MAG: hypothetical protein DI498_03140 [Paracoccus denitrificans]PZO85526.1 MAG: hypothetical protein DI633_03140 [Paracoccus denitrificans]